MSDSGELVSAEDSGSDDPVLAACRVEMQRAIGFENDAILREDRERALNYRKGNVSQDIPSLPNRSKAVSSDLSDAIETVKPDLIEIFTGGDDIVAFIPQKATDVEAARQETAYLHHVAFQQNDGFLNFNTAIDDALLLKTGVFHWEWQEDIEEQTERFTGKNAVEMQLAAQDGEISGEKADAQDDPTAQPTYSFTLTKRKDNSRAAYWAIAPDDFAAAADTINIADTAYCCERQRPRVQDLIAKGFDKDKVRALPAWFDTSDQSLQIARDNAGESLQNGNGGDQTNDDLRQVEVRKHCIRQLGDDGKLEIWCLYTDVEATTEICEREKLERIPYAVGSPYIVAHRLIGRSLADMLIEIMRIKTALYRMCLDSGYFALNQRMEVAEDRMGAYTMSDLLRNEPAVPVRSKSGDAVRPLQAGALNFDPYQAIEFFSTVAEGRTGVVRNAQGMNPDTLHDTASGAMMLLSAAQKRTKMIARTLAETLIKPLFLGLHACIRENASSVRESQLLGKWVPVDPSKWGERNAMTVEVGLGASGKDLEIASMNQVIGAMRAIVEEQGGAEGPIVTVQNVFKAATDLAKKLGVKAPEEYFTDPSTQPPQQPKPSPEMAKVQGDMQLQQSKQQGDMQIAQLNVQSQQQIANAKAQAQAAVSQQQNELEHARMVAQQQGEMALEQLKIASSERIAIAVARIKAEAQIEAARVMAKNQTDDGADQLAYQESHETTA